MAGDKETGKRKRPSKGTKQGTTSQRGTEEPTQDATTQAGRSSGAAPRGGGSRRGQWAESYEDWEPGMYMRVPRTAALHYTEVNDAIRVTLKPENYPWVSKKDFKDCKGKTWGPSTERFLSVYASDCYHKWTTSDRKVIPLKIWQRKEFENDTEMSAVAAWLNPAGWNNLWSNSKTKHCKSQTLLFYANMWVDMNANGTVGRVHSVLKGIHLNWDASRINTLLGTPDEGHTFLLTTRWDATNLGVSLQEVKDFMEYKGPTELNLMSLPYRALLIVVTYCVCGKTGKLPSLLDLFIAYKLVKGEKVNFGAIFLQSLYEAASHSSKALTFSNIIRYLIEKENVSLDDELIEDIAPEDYYGIAGINQMRKIRNKAAKGKGKEPVGAEEEEEDEIARQEGNPDPPASDSELDIPYEVDRLNKDVTDVYDRLGSHLDEISTLKTQVAALKEENTQVKTKYSKLKTKLKSFIPGLCFSSDEEDRAAVP